MTVDLDAEELHAVRRVLELGCVVFTEDGALHVTCRRLLDQLPPEPLPPDRPEGVPPE